MQRCLELAQLGHQYAAPNPMVGAVLVHNGRIIGEGWHQQYGGAHAEVNCLSNVSEADKPLIPESTMYVSLEPCAHYGKTPPCATRLVQERVRKVVIANVDPFAKVSGNGISILKQAGIEVETGILADEGNWLNRRFFCSHQLQRPYIILKWAQSAEGNMAPADRSRLQLSNAFSGRMVHQWRTEEAAIMVGFRTALQDDPQLTARHRQGPQPLRIALDRRLQLPQTHRLFDAEAPTWIVNESEERTQGHLRYLKLASDDEILPNILTELHRHHKLSLIVEGGPALLQHFLDRGLWDEARVFQTSVQLPGGIAAPQLSGADLCFDAPVAGDRLQLWTRNGTAYPYAAGMTF